MEEFSKFEKFNVLGDTVNILCTDTDYGVSAVAEIEDSIYYIGLLREHKETGRIRFDVEESPSIFLAIVAWSSYFDRRLSEADYITVLGANLNDAELLKILEADEHASTKIDPGE